MSLLEEIVSRKKAEIVDARKRRSLQDLERALPTAPSLRPLTAKRRDGGNSRPGVIAEMKRRSPSRGLIRDPYDPAALADSYWRSGAQALSILTDGPFFGGDLEDLSLVRKTPAGEALPLLRKDFVVDPYQVVESRVAGADILLLIVRILPGELLSELLHLASSLGLTVLVETHTEGEVERALAAGARVVGVNSRDLDTLKVDLDRGARLLAGIPPEIVKVAESGLKTPADYLRMGDLGADFVLVGERFLLSDNPGRALEVFCGIVD
ncbi:MAG: indole-3-glycerol phosphate synthase TrpC [Leptospirillia bacterium]